MLNGVAGLRSLRPRMLRHKREEAHIAAWLETVRAAASTNYDFALEVVKCRRLVKGYSDTHAPGCSKFDRVLSAVPLVATRPDGAAWIRRLRNAALLDEPGEALDGTLMALAELNVPEAVGRTYAAPLSAKHTAQV